MHTEFKVGMYVVFNGGVYRVAVDENEKGHVGLEFSSNGVKRVVTVAASLCKDASWNLLQETAVSSRERLEDMLRIAKKRSGNQRKKRMKATEELREKKGHIRKLEASNAAQYSRILRLTPFEEQVKRMWEFLNARDLCPDCGWFDLCHDVTGEKKPEGCHLRRWFDAGELPGGKVVLYRCEVALEGRCDLDMCERFNPTPRKESYQCLDARKKVKMVPVVNGKKALLGTTTIKGVTPEGEPDYDTRWEVVKLPEGGKG